MKLCRNWTSVSGGYVFVDISYLELWRTLNLAEQNHLYNFKRGHHEEQLCEIILNLDCDSGAVLKNSYLELWWPSCLAKPNHLCILAEGIMGNIL